MKFGIMFANIGPMAFAEGAVGIAQAAEAAGFESLWTVEHPLVTVGYQSQYPYSPTGKMPGPEESDIPDPLIWLAYVAAATSTIRLGTGILILPHRNPVIVGKEIATLDRLSGGRVELGIGVGWLEEEFDALGIPFADRGKRTDDHVAVLRELWSEGPASHESEFTSFPDAYSRPRPANGTVPIVVGGHSKAAARRLGYTGGLFRQRQEKARAERPQPVGRRSHLRQAGHKRHRSAWEPGGSAQAVDRCSARAAFGFRSAQPAPH